jgi:hypothetical protein
VLEIKRARDSTYVIAYKSLKRDGTKKKKLLIESLKLTHLIFNLVHQEGPLLKPLKRATLLVWLTHHI